MDPEIKELLQAQQAKIDAIHNSVEKTRKYLLWTMIATVAFFVLPLIALAVLAPMFLSTYMGTLTDLGL